MCSRSVFVTDSFAGEKELRELQPGSVIRPAAAAAPTIDLISPIQPAPPRHDLRLGGDPLHLPLLGALRPGTPTQLAFHSPNAWAQRLLDNQLDLVLLSVAGASADPATSQPPPLKQELAAGVEAIRLGQRPLLLFHQPNAGARAGTRATAQWPANGVGTAMATGPINPPTGYLLPPVTHSPLLHTTLSREARLPLHCCGASDPQHWLALLQLGTLLLPAHLTLLTLAPWRAAGLQPLRPLKPLSETLWLLLRRDEASEPALAELLEWWGGSPPQQPQSGKDTTITSSMRGHWWRWLRRAGLLR